MFHYYSSGSTGQTDGRKRKERKERREETTGISLPLCPLLLPFEFVSRFRTTTLFCSNSRVWEVEGAKSIEASRSRGEKRRGKQGEKQVERYSRRKREGRREKRATASHTVLFSSLCPVLSVFSRRFRAAGASETQLFEETVRLIASAALRVSLLIHTQYVQAKTERRLY